MIPPVSLLEGGGGGGGGGIATPAETTLGGVGGWETFVPPVGSVGD